MSRARQNLSGLPMQHLSLEQMQAYLADKLPAPHMHQVERHLLDCELCSDAMDGLAAFSSTDHTAGIVENLKQQVRAQSLSNPAVEDKGNIISVWWKPASIAATILVLLTATFILLKPGEEKQNTPGEISMTTQKVPLVIKEKTVIPQESPQATQLQAAEPKQEAYASKPLAMKKTMPVPFMSKADSSESFGNATVAEQMEVVEDNNFSDAVVSAPPPVIEAEKSIVFNESAPMRTEANKERKIPEVSIQENTNLHSRQASGITEGFITVSGKVISADDETPLPGINVVIKGTTSGTTTDSYGKYTLLAPINGILLFSFIGMRTEEIAVPTKKGTLDVSLQSDVASLSEVVVVGYGEEKDKTEEPYSYVKPQPVGGYPDFKNYIQQNLKYPQEAKQKKIEGTVKIEFAINADGQLSDFKIKKGLGYGCDEEAIRLVKEGPSWKAAVLNGEIVKRKMTTNIQFKL